MALEAEEIVAAGAEIIWVLERDNLNQPGNANRCMQIMDVLKSPEQGWCVGDGQTQPTALTFDNSPFSVQRGFDMIVRRDTMEIMFTTSHGTSNGNENISGEDVLAAVQAAVASL